MLEKDIKKVLFSQEDIVAKTKELGQQVTEKNPLLVCVLKVLFHLWQNLSNISIPILRWTLWSFQVMVVELSAVVK